MLPLPEALPVSSPEPVSERVLLEALFRRALRSVEGAQLVRSRSRLDADCWRYSGPRGALDFDIPADGRLIVVGAGKAAASLALGLEDVLGDRIDDGCIVVKYGHTEKLKHIRQYEAGHPLPDANGVEGTRRLLATLDGLTPCDRVIVALTGGASALLVDPVDGVTLDDKAAVTRLMLHSGASIDEINAVRKTLSNVKGGGLLARIAPASSVTLLISDVPDGDFGTIGSGPTIAERENGPDAEAIFRRYNLLERLPAGVVDAVRHRRSQGGDRPSGRHDVLLLADSADLVREVGNAAAQAGLQSRVVSAAMHGETHEEADAFVDAAITAVRAGERGLLLVGAGETTLEVTGGGTGGRNQEFALHAARRLDGVDGITLLAAGTDGTDGPTDAAGGFADGGSWQRAIAAGLDPGGALADNDSHPLLAALGDLLVTGPSGTNVMDLVLALVGPGTMRQSAAP